MTRRSLPFFDRLQRFFRPIVTYCTLMIDPTTPWRVRIMLAAGVIYLLSPWDLIPDWLLGIGIVDDVAVIALLGWLAAKMMAKDRHDIP